MPQLYLFIISLLAIIVIVARRNYIVERVKRFKFKEDVAQKVDQLQRERQKMQSERFKEAHLKEQKKKKYDFKD